MTDANTLGSFNLAYSTFEQILDIYNFIPEIYVLQFYHRVISYMKKQEYKPHKGTIWVLLEVRIKLVTSKLFIRVD